MGLSEPDMITVARLIGPHRHGATDYGFDFERAEIATVEAVGRGRIHCEQLAAAQLAASEPGGERPTGAVPRSGDTNQPAVYSNAVRKAADEIGRAQV